ncbi:MAG: CoA-binding protein [Cyclobacteriaceae bacterium]|nr:CoA-binding protein [Cyclobacteriaceae bacterium]
MKTVIVGATPNETRYAYIAADMLTEYGHEIVPIGIKKGEVFGKEILNIRAQPIIENTDTITLYIGSQHQAEYYQYLMGLKPRRVIFNPGTENPEFEKLLRTNNIEPIEACTLVLLRTGQY